MESSEYKKVFDQGPYAGLLELSDAKIFTEDGSSFDIHKVVLSKKSDFFRGLFCGLEKGKKAYKISSISSNLLSDILVFIYTKDVCVTEANINELLRASDFFSLNHLYSKILSQIKDKLSNSNCLRLCLTAYQLSDSQILRWCMNFIEPRFEQLISYNKHAVDDFPLELLRTILSKGNLNVKSEKTIWQVIVHWVQACPESRVKHVASLLSTLAVCEIDANLANQIVNHEIVSGALNDKASLTGSSSPTDVIKSIVPIPKYFRIPQTLTLISENSTLQGSMKIFISFDEAINLWRMISEIPNFSANSVIAIGPKIYFFEKLPSIRCLIFNLKTMRWKIIQNAYHERINAIFTVENTLYTLVQEGKTYHIDEYDVEKNICIRISSLNNFDHASATAIGEDIFFVGALFDSKTNVARMFNVVTYKWTDFSSPIEFCDQFELVPHHNKICLIGYSEGEPEVEVFYPAMNVWRDISVFHRYDDFDVHSIILNDKLVIYSIDDVPSIDTAGLTALLWHDETPVHLCCWEKLEKTALPGDLHRYRSCTINDVGSIKIITKRNRNSQEQLKKSAFNFVY